MPGILSSICVDQAPRLEERRKDIVKFVEGLEKNKRVKAFLGDFKTKEANDRLVNLVDWMWRRANKV